MQIYIDESGSINNQNKEHSRYFVVAMVCICDDEEKKKKVLRAYKRFVSSNQKELNRLDQDRTLKDGKIRTGGKMFSNGKFEELKGSQFDPAMKRRFVDFFTRNPCFEVYYIKIDNTRLEDKFCENTARAFNYTLKLALGHFISKGFLPDEKYILQLDERNERTGLRYFLANYLNTELILEEKCNGPFEVRYFDSSCNRFIQIADVFSNLYYSHLQTGGYDNEIEKLAAAGIVKGIFEFPPVFAKN